MQPRLRAKGRGAMSFLRLYRCLCCSFLSLQSVNSPTASDRPPFRQYTIAGLDWTGTDWNGLERWTGLRIYVIFICACVELLNSTCIRLSYCTACVKVEVRALYIVRHGVVRGEQRRSYCFGQPPFLGQGAG